MTNKIELELWADNQFEARWLLEDIVLRSTSNKWKAVLSDLQGFIPKLVISKNNQVITIIGFGGYKFWNHLPKSISDVLSEGKVDHVLYDRNLDRMLFANEDSSATMTGNQSQQRAERMVAFAKNNVPFSYLLPAFAIKTSDRVARRPNLWVPITALCLIAAYKVPVTVFYFGSKSDPDNKLSGEGTNQLGLMFWSIILKHIGDKNTFSEIIKNQVKIMLNEVSLKNSTLFYNLPNWDDKYIDDWSKYLSNLCLKDSKEKYDNLPFNWNVPINKLNVKSNKKNCYIETVLSKNISEDIFKKRAYFPIRGSSRGRPSLFEEHKKNIEKQKIIHRAGEEILKIPYEDLYSKIIEDGFTSKGKASPSIMHKSLIRYERFKSLRQTIENSCNKFKNIIDTKNDNFPAILFIANNLVTNFLRDPYSGMLASYAVANGSLDPRQKTIIFLWAPYQTVMLACKFSGKDLLPKNNKGSKSWVNHADYTLFNNNILVTNHKDGRLSYV